MDEKVKNYLEERRNAILQEKQEEREKKLIALGLFNEQKVFSEPKLELARYPYSEYDAETENYYYIKRTAIDVSDAEFDEICKVAPKNEEFANYAISLGKELSLKNWGSFFIVLGILDLIGGIVALGISGENWIFAVAGISGFFVCLMFNALLKVIANISARIDEINKKTK